MAWGKADEMFSQEMQRRQEASSAEERDEFKSSIVVTRGMLLPLIEEINRVLGFLDEDFKAKYGKLPRELDEIVIGVGPFGELGMIVEDFFSRGDTLFMSLDRNDILYVESGESQFSRLSGLQFIDQEFSGLDKFGRGIFRNHALIIKDGYITVYKNGLLSDVLLKISLETGRVV